MALQTFVRWFLPKDDNFYEYLESQGKLCREGAEAFGEFRDGRSADQVRAKVQDLEHQADDVVRKLEDALARTFVTPLDREDLHKLSNDLDDILDLTNLAARTCSLYGVQKPSEAMGQLIQALIEATTVLEKCVPHLRKHEYPHVVDLGREIRAIEKRADDVFRAAVSQLFTDKNIDAKELLKQKDILEHIEHAIDHCDNVGDILTNLAVKHG